MTNSFLVTILHYPAIWGWVDDGKGAPLPQIGKKRGKGIAQTEYIRL